ncbi:signal peptidase II [Nocardiopsis metallicus]|uniref:Lipoprotein signal peptidase n=1 Tax=Nocardiopsis metallicus TaxID=179819 RepID=A0A840W1X9_9ACTN|nr:signal peptidase II [Nocardiopsis metallicus]MBB5489273.1 signal peptidase II [Nocardiopsis metallicus]
MTTTDNTVARPRRYVLLLLVALAAIVADFLTKEWVLAAFSQGERLDVIGSFVQFTLVYNTGAAFSLGTGYTWVFTAIATVVVLAIAYIGWRVRSVWWGVTLGLMMGGAAGNLVDRYFRGEAPGTGAVVDFISVGTFPVFNIADSCVVVGACLVVALTFKGLNLDGTMVADETADEDTEIAGPAEAGDGGDTGTSGGTAGRDSAENDGGENDKGKGA